MIAILIENTDTNDLVATVTDLNTVPPTTVATTQRINKGQQFSVNVQEDGNGQALVNVVTAFPTDLSRSKSFPNQSCLAGGIISVDLFGV
jgi:hypothetical protein